MNSVRSVVNPAGSALKSTFLLGLQAQLGGTIPFDRFMREALYHPSLGYYTSQIRTVGRRGDFSTWATLDQSLAKAIASWLKKSTARHVIEVGAGSGALACDVLASLGWWNRRKITYHIVEVSEPLRAKQQESLRGSKVHWHTSMQSALEVVHGEASIFSNELPDAFPCRIFEKTDKGWIELHVQITDEKFHEVLQECELPKSTAFDHPFPTGCRVEVHESYHFWMRDWAPLWKKGELLTIDYGDTMPSLYHRRPAGTIRGYAHHQLLTGPDLYQSPGRCDITADVNFSDLENWGNQLNWQIHANSTLTKFLSTRLPNHSLSPQLESAGTAFRTLIQSPVERP